MAALVAVIAVTILFTEVPYRSFNHRDFERVDYAGARCYIIGESGNEFLILCPAAAPPRNRVVQRDDPRAAKTGYYRERLQGSEPGSIESLTVPSSGGNVRTRQECVMKRVAMFVLVCVCVLVPSVAHANDGGWWDWLWKWDAKFMGVGSEIHLLCLDESGNRLRRVRTVVQEHRPQDHRERDAGAG